jgi:hypothetical protein
MRFFHLEKLRAKAVIFLQGKKASLKFSSNMTGGLFYILISLNFNHRSQQKNHIMDSVYCLKPDKVKKT